MIPFKYFSNIGQFQKRDFDSLNIKSDWDMMKECFRDYAPGRTDDMDTIFSGIKLQTVQQIISLSDRKCLGIIQNDQYLFLGLLSKAAIKIL